MNKYSYYRLTFTGEPDIATVSGFPKCDIKSWEFFKGISLKERMPTDFIVSLDCDYGDTLTDIVEHEYCLPIITGEIKEIFEANGVSGDNIEYLPIIIKDKEGSQITEHDYFIANSLQRINCLDYDKIKDSALQDGEEDNEKTHYYGGIFYKDEQKDKIYRLEYLYLKEDTIPDDALFFRIGESPNCFMLRSDLADVLKKNKVTGLNIEQKGRLK
jgi:hypothetical protein